MKDETYNKLLSEIKSVIDNFEYEKQCKTRVQMQEETPKILEAKLKKRIWKDISPDLYLIFWYLKLDKIFIPE